MRYFKVSVGERSTRIEVLAKAGMDIVEVRMSAWVAKILVRIQYPENLRFPLEGSSAEG
jgi:hypothetical protein